MTRTDGFNMLIEKVSSDQKVRRTDLHVCGVYKVKTIDDFIKTLKTKGNERIGYALSVYNALSPEDPITPRDIFSYPDPAKEVLMIALKNRMKAVDLASDS